MPLRDGVGQNFRLGREGLGTKGRDFENGRQSSSGPSNALRCSNYCSLWHSLPDVVEYQFSEGDCVNSGWFSTHRVHVGTLRPRGASFSTRQNRAWPDIAQER